jgi:hypothetical protein
MIHAVQMDEQEIKIVRVTTSDYNKVMDIFPPSEIYEGTDYLPDYFHLLLDMSNVEAYAVVADDKFTSRGGISVAGWQIVCLTTHVTLYMYMMSIDQ